MNKKTADQIGKAYKRLHCKHKWQDNGIYAEGHSEHSYYCSLCDKHLVCTPFEFEHMRGY